MKKAKKIGRPRLGENKKQTVQVCLSPENVDFLTEKGKGKSNYVDSLLDRERKSNNKRLTQSLPPSGV